MATLSPIMTVMTRTAEKAGRTLVRDFGEIENLQVSRKGPGDFVTAADKRSEEIIFEELKKVYPKHSFLMEESGEVKGDDPDHVWIIDPIDGTHNFMHGLPHWCISIALEVKGRVEAGVVYDPVKDEMFRAERSGGAYMGRKRLRVSSRQNMESAIIAFGSSRHDSKDQGSYIKEIAMMSVECPMIRRWGAAALDLSYIAAGRIDGFWERGLKPWDAAAAVLILKESGGFVTSIDNEENPIYSQNLVAGNQEIHKQTRKILRDVQKSQ